MKVCNKEAMKLVKELEAKKAYVINAESQMKNISYKEDEGRPVNDYDYAETRKKVAELDAQIRKIKSALAKANCKIKIEEFGVTLGEALVMLAQLNEEYSRLELFSHCKQQVRRITTTGVVIYDEYLFDVKQVAKDCEAMQKKINKLQVEIDRANLTNYIEI